MRDMSPEETRAFLMHGTRTGKIATVRADGRPHVVPIWFVLDGDDLLFSTWHATTKGRNLRREPNVSICVDDEAPPYSFVQFNGRATMSDDRAELERWATVIGGRYMGEGQAEEFGRRNAVEGEHLVRVTPTKVIAIADMAA